MTTPLNQEKSPFNFRGFDASFFKYIKQETLSLSKFKTPVKFSPKKPRKMEGFCSGEQRGGLGGSSWAIHEQYPQGYYTPTPPPPR